MNDKADDTAQDTGLDRAHGAMMAAPDDDRPRLAYYHRLADTELYLLLTTEPAADSLAPAIFPLDEARYALAFDSEERLATFADGPQPYAVLPGRVIVAELAGQGVGLGLNLAVADSAFLMPPQAIDWLADALKRAPEAGGDRPAAYFPPSLPGLAATIADKLAGLAALAQNAYLVGARLADGRAGHVLVFQNAHPAAHDALAKATTEAILFSGTDPAAVELMFMSPRQISAEGIRDIADRIEISAPPEAAPEPAPEPAAAPGSDPAKPPRLR